MFLTWIQNVGGKCTRAEIWAKKYAGPKSKLSNRYKQQLKPLAVQEKQNARSIVCSLSLDEHFTTSSFEIIQHQTP